MLLPLGLGISTTPFSIAFRATVVFFSLILIIRNISLPYKIRISKGYIYLLIFWTLYSIRLVYDLSIAEVKLSPRLQSPQFIYLYAIGSTFLPMLAAIGVLKKYDLKKIKKNIFWLSLIQVICITFIFFKLYGLTLEAFLSRHVVSQAMSEAELGQPISVITISRSGGLLAILAILLSPQSIFMRFMKYGALFLGIAILILGASRGPFIAFALTLLFMIVQAAINNKKNFLWFLSFLVFLVFILSLILILILNPEILEFSVFGRFNTLLSDKQNIKGEERFVEWSMAFRQFLSSPLIGDQMVTESVGTYPHNLFLEVLMATGLIGFIPFILSTYHTFKRGVKLVEKGYSEIFYLFLYSFIAMIFSGAIFLSPEFWTTMVLVLGVSMPKYRNNL